MPCTTILVGKNASYDGSTLVARNEDSSNGVFEPKRMRVVHPDEQPRVYTSVLSHLTVELHAFGARRGLCSLHGRSRVGVAGPLRR